MTAVPLTRTRARGTTRRRAGIVLRPLVVFTLAVVLAFFAMIYSRISLDRTAFELHTIEQGLAAQDRIHWDLRLELARLQDPLRITEAAAETVAPLIAVDIDPEHRRTLAHALVGLAEAASLHLVGLGEAFDPDEIAGEISALAWAGLRATHRVG